MRVPNTLLITGLIKEYGEVISASIYLPPDAEGLSCVVCSKTITDLGDRRSGGSIRVSHRSIEWQLKQKYVWVSVPTDKYVQVFCLRCAEIELLVPRI